MRVYGKQSKRCAPLRGSFNLVAATASPLSSLFVAAGWAASAPTVYGTAADRATLAHTTHACQYANPTPPRATQQRRYRPEAFIALAPLSRSSHRCRFVVFQPTAPYYALYARVLFLPSQVLSLRAQVEGLGHDAVVATPSKRVDAPPADFSTPSPLPAAQRGESKSYNRTQSSPALSPRISASLRQLASAVDAGEEGGRGGGGIGGGTEDSPSLNGRTKVGPGTTNPNESFTSPAGIAGTGTGIHKAGVLGWWKRTDYREDGQVANKEKPRPITEDQERLGNLYSMIARR